MKTSFFDILMIISMAVLLLLLNYFGLLERYAKFAMIPLLAFYFLGKYAGYKYGRSKE